MDTSERDKRLHLIWTLLVDYKKFRQDIYLRLEQLETRDLELLVSQTTANEAKPRTK